MSTKYKDLAIWCTYHYKTRHVFLSFSNSIYFLNKCNLFNNNFDFLLVIYVLISLESEVKRFCVYMKIFTFE